MGSFPVSSLPCQQSLVACFKTFPYLDELWNYSFAHFFCFVLMALKTSSTPFSDFLSLVSFFSLQRILPCSLPTIYSSPPLPFTPCRIVSLSELARSHTRSQSQTAWAKPNTQGGSKTATHKHTHTSPLNPAKKLNAIDEITNGKNRMCI